MKTGRNEPCPCGSGKKYKKCCGFDVPRGLPSPELPKKTGTVWDDYMMLSKMVIFYGQTQRQFAQDKNELNRIHGDLERRFRQGKEGGIIDSFFMTMFHFDIAYGEEQKTIIDRFLEEDIVHGLHPPGPTLLRHLQNSYCAMYEVAERKDNILTLSDIMTSQRYDVICLGEPYEDDAQAGQIWYVRLVGTPQQSVTLTTPYVFDADAKKSFQEIMRNQIKTFKKMTDMEGLSGEEIHRRSCKAAVGFWAAYMTAPWQEEGPSQPPAMVNMDRQRMIFCRLIMTVKDVPAAKRALDQFDEAVFDGHSGHWIWQKRRRTKKMLGENIVLGEISLENGKLVAMTNSMQRALRLKNKLLRVCAQTLVYEKIEAVTPEAMPPPAPEQIKQFEEEQKAILSDPVVRQAAEKSLRDYYFKSWVRQKIPMLGFKTPLEASKTPQGREELKALFAHMENLSSAVPGESVAEMDFEELKKKLGVL